jgi:hypothetical protein
MAKKRKPPKKKGPPKPLGRKPDISEAQISNLVTLISNCTSYKTACEASGLGEATFHRWMAAALEENAKPCYVEFRERITQARGIAKASMIKHVVSKAPDDWRAATWLLERTAHDEYGDKSKINVEHQGAIQHDHTHKQIVVVLPPAIAAPKPIRRIEATSEPVKPENPAS